MLANQSRLIPSWYWSRAWVQKSRLAVEGLHIPGALGLGRPLSRFGDLGPGKPPNCLLIYPVFPPWVTVRPPLMGTCNSFSVLFVVIIFQATSSGRCWRGLQIWMPSPLAWTSFWREAPQALKARGRQIVPHYAVMLLYCVLLTILWRFVVLYYVVLLCIPLYCTLLYHGTM